jgi:F0F1-type ATP synthase assembly protein I
MRVKLLAVGSLAAGLTLFAWQTVSQVMLPWHRMTMQEFTNAPQVIEAIQAGGSGNGMYFAGEGILAAVSFTPTLEDKTSMAFMGAMLAKQLVVDIIVGALLCMLLLVVPHIAPRDGARIAAMAALASALTARASDWIWYGFSALHTLVNSLDLVIGWSIVGAVLGWLIRRLSPAGAPRHAEHGVKTGVDLGPRAGSLRPVGKH